MIIALSVWQLFLPAYKNIRVEPMTENSKPNSLGLPDKVVGALSAADAARGLPPGTMASVMKQEVGGLESKYLLDPTKYHYDVREDGKRGPKGKDTISTAFGPFGIVESTAKDPGYGVKPLTGKTFQEQLDFAADYLVARAKQAGSLAAGLAGYGEGAKYSKQVMNRTGGEPVVVAQAAPAPPSSRDAVLPTIAGGLPPQQEGGLGNVLPPNGGYGGIPSKGSPDQWLTFVASLRRNTRPQDLSYGQPPITQVAVNQPNFGVGNSSGVDMNPLSPFRAFDAWG